MSPADAAKILHWRSHLRDGLADVFGLRVLSPDQERLVEAIQRYGRVVSAGGTGTGKSFVQGNCARLLTMLYPSKALFGGPRLEQAAKLSWLEFQRAHDAAIARGLPPGGKLGSYDWQGPARDWFAVCMALSDRNNAAPVKGMLHAERALIVLDEMEGIAEDIRDALDAGTTQEGAHYWVAFNPISPDDAAGQFWSATRPEARIKLSAIDCAEWQASRGIVVPGMPTLAAISEKWAGRESEPLYYTNVLGEFPPESATWVVLPKGWYDQCRGAWAPEPADLAHVGLGVDTAGGRAENVIAVATGRFVRVAWHSREQHQTPILVTRVKEVANQYGRNVPIAVDVIGMGGKGVADGLRADGYNALDFVGGGREFAGRKDDTDLSADVATWAWWAVREAARKTTEGTRALVTPDDLLLRDQFARRYEIAKDRRYKMESKDSANSPDRADAVAMAWLAATCGQSYAPNVGGFSWQS